MKSNKLTFIYSLITDFTHGRLPLRFILKHKRDLTRVLSLGFSCNLPDRKQALFSARHFTIKAYFHFPYFSIKERQFPHPVLN